MQYSDDTGKRLTGVVSPEGSITTFNIDGNARLLGYQDGDGVGKAYSYRYDSSTEKHYTRITDTSGTVTEVWNNRLGQPVRRAVNGETVLTAKYILSDNSTDVTRISEDYRQLGAEAYGYQSGSASRARYLSSKIQEKERPYVKRVEETDAFGNTTRKHYNRARDLLKTEYPDGTASSATYNSRGQRTEFVAVDGTRTHFEYDDRGNLITLTEAAGTALERVTRYTFNNLGQVTAMTAPGGSTTRLEYDAFGNVTRQTDPLGKVTQFQDYVGLGNPRTVIDARGNRWVSTFDAAGNLLTITDPLNKVVTYRYDGNGRVQTITDPNGEITTLESNAAGLPTAVIDALNGRTELTYDKANRLTRLLDAEGKRLKREYDSRGRLKALIDGNDNTTTWEYDNTRLTGIQYPTYRENYRYDNRDRTTVEQQHFNAGADEASPLTELTRRFDYLIDSNLKQRSDANSNTSGYEYDALDRLIAMTDAEGGVTRYGYDARDNLVSVIDPEGRETRFEYNLRDEVTAEIKVGQGGLSDTRRSYQYDDNGNLIQITTPNGEVTAYRYDTANRLDEARYYASSIQQGQNLTEKTVSYRYTPTNQFAGYDDNRTEAVYGYDALNRLTDVTTTFNKGTANAFSKTIGYSYYKNGLKKSYTSPEGQTYTYEYDNNNQLSGITIPGQGRISYAEHQWLSPTQIIYPGGSATRMVYDGLLRPLDKQTQDPASNSMLSLGWGYDNESNITGLGIRHGQQSKESASYSYDKLYRLTTADYSISNDGFGEAVTPRTNEAYSYDGVGNRLDSKSSPADLAPDVWQYNAFNQLTEQNGISYDYGKNGHLIKSGKRNSEGHIAVDPDNQIPFWEFIYNSEERLIAVKKNTATVAQYQYNPLGQRTQKVLAEGTTIHYLYSQEGLVGEYADDGSLLQEYGWKPHSLWMTDPLFTRTADDNVHYYVNDHLGTPQKTFTRNGAVTWQARATAFGETEVHPDSRIANNLRFAGQYYDDETALNYNLFRDYDPSLGWYIQSDPIGLNGGLNVYVYSNGNPVNFIDSFGLCPWCIFGAVIGGGINVWTQYSSNGGFDNFNWGSFFASTASGAFGGALGTLTVRVGTNAGWLIASNSVGSSAIGAGVTAAQNKLTGSCNSISDAAINGFLVGGFGAGAGAAMSSGISALNRARYNSLPLATRLMLGSNAIYGYPQPVLIPGGVTISNAASNTISNMSIYQNGKN
nr:RHS repeat-associated core domain-containing protein [Kistimonas asteriae]